MTNIVQSVCAVLFAIFTFHNADGECVYGSVIRQPGETYDVPGNCTEITCHSDGSWTAVGCAEVQVDTASGWTVSDVDLSKPYPTCCPQAIPPSTATPAVVCVKDDQVLQVGETYSPLGDCVQYLCTEDGELAALACGLIAVPTGWTVIPEDLSKRYPDCCAKAVPPTSRINKI